MLGGCDEGGSGAIETGGAVVNACAGVLAFVRPVSCAPAARDRWHSGMPAGYKTTLDGDQLFDEALVPPDPDVPEFIPRPVETQYVKPWSDEHAAKFGVPPRQSKSKKRRPGQKHKQSPSLDPLDGLDDLDS